MDINKELKELASRCADCGVSEAVLRKLLRNGPPDLDDRAKLLGLRLSLGIEFNRQEYFSVEDIAHITGTTEKEAMGMMLSIGAKPIEMSIAPWLKGVDGAEGRCDP